MRWWIGGGGGGGGGLGGRGGLTAGLAAPLPRPHVTNPSVTRCVAPTPLPRLCEDPFVVVLEAKHRTRPVIEVEVSFYACSSQLSALRNRVPDTTFFYRFAELLMLISKYMVPNCLLGVPQRAAVLGTLSQAARGASAAGSSRPCTLLKSACHTRTFDLFTLRNQQDGVLGEFY